MTKFPRSIETQRWVVINQNGVRNRRDKVQDKLSKNI